MLTSRTFTVVVVSPDTPVGYRGAAAPGRTVPYTGAAVTLRF
jgi:hypothetical protein